MKYSTRRGFIRSGVSVAGGLLLSFNIPLSAKKITGIEDYNPENEINAWLTVDPDNTVTIRVAQAEMGQGVLTSMPMIVAEELHADWRNVRASYADPNRSIKNNRVYRRMLTGGSSAVRKSRPYLQHAGAVAREKLIAAAAKNWEVGVGDCYAKDGYVYHKNSGRSYSYGELARTASQITVSDVDIKSPAEFTLLGKELGRLDTPAKVDGSAVFAMDVRLPDMVYAAVVHCPVIGGGVNSFKIDDTIVMPGVLKVVSLEAGVAVVAKTYWQAKKAADKLQIQWAVDPAIEIGTQAIEQEYIAALDSGGIEVHAVGDSAAAFSGAAKILTSDYQLPYLAHACMEPLNCTVHISQGKVDVWAGVQDAEAVLNLVADITDFPPEQVYVHNCFLGGGFGRRNNYDFVREAVAIAKEVKLPVQMIWSRESDIRGGQYRPMAVLRFKAGFDAQNNVTAYENHSVTHSIFKDIGVDVSNGVDRASVEGLANMPYDIEHKNITHTIKNTHMTTWFWRSVGSSINAFAVESFVDEMAEAANMDPLEFRIQRLSHRPDLIRVLNELKEKASWGRTMPSGMAQGLAIHECFGSIVAQVAEVAIDNKGGVSVQRIVSVVDCGHLINPLTATMQIESGIVYGLTAALYGKLTIEAGRVLESNFNNYRMLTMDETPVMETHWSLSGGDKWGGLGEPGVPCVAPAVTNAIYKITRQRIRSLPILENL